MTKAQAAVPKAPLKVLIGTGTREVVCPDEVDHSEEIERLQALNETLGAYSKTLLGVEGEAAERVQRRRNALWRRTEKLRDEMRENEALRKQAQQRREMSESYHRLSVEPFSWRDRRGLPVLAIFSLDSPVCRIGRQGWQLEIEPELPPLLRDCWLDVREAVEDKEATCTFAGVIPKEVKVQIRKAGPDFQKIFLVAESQWELKRLEPKKDPLVVGYDGYDLYLVTAFDTTDIEERAFYTLPLDEQTE